jgi:hypothetical protein
MSVNSFYRLLADPAATSRRFLKAPLDPSGNEVDPRLFTQGRAVDLQPLLKLPLRRHGDVVDFNFCDFDMVVSPTDFNAELEALVGLAIQRFPVVIDEGGEFEILNVCDLVPCVDESRSLYTKWIDADGRPDKSGQFRTIIELKITPAAARGHHIFRVAEWPITLVVSDLVKRLFEAKNLSGVKYEPVD